MCMWFIYSVHGILRTTSLLPENFSSLSSIHLYRRIYITQHISNPFFVSNEFFCLLILCLVFGKLFRHSSLLSKISVSDFLLSVKRLLIQLHFYICLVLTFIIHSAGPFLLLTTIQSVFLQLIVIPSLLLSFSILSKSSCCFISVPAILTCICKHTNVQSQIYTHLHTRFI